MKVVFFGTPAFAVPTFERLIQSGHTVVGVVTQPDRPRDRGQRPSEGPVKRLAIRHGIPVLQPERLKDEAFVAALTALAADLGVVAAYGKILPAQVLAIPPLGLINVHASLLPRHRGAAPIQRAVLAGETVTGVSIMRIVREMDAGPVFATHAVAIGPDETSERLAVRLAEVGADLLMGVVGEIEQGRAREAPQDERLATYAPRLTKEEGLIRWDEPASAVHNRVRGLHPWPHAYTHLGETRYIILESAVGIGKALRDGAVDRECCAGGIIEATPASLRVACGGGTWLSIRRIQAEGRRPMAVREFLAGHPLATGMRFGSG